MMNGVLLFVDTFNKYILTQFTYYHSIFLSLFRLYERLENYISKKNKTRKVKKNYL